MPVKIILGEPLWRDLGVHELEWEVGSEGLGLSDVLSRLETEATAAVPHGRRAMFPHPGDPNLEAGLLVMLNDRVVLPAEVGALRVRNGDCLSLQIALSGG